MSKFGGNPNDILYYIFKVASDDLFTFLAPFPSIKVSMNCLLTWRWVFIKQHTLLKFKITDRMWTSITLLLSNRYNEEWVVFSAQLQLHCRIFIYLFKSLWYEL